jgi:hypothetical protein
LQFPSQLWTLLLSIPPIVGYFAAAYIHWIIMDNADDVYPGAKIIKWQRTSKWHRIPSILLATIPYLLGFGLSILWIQLPI